MNNLQMNYTINTMYSVANRQPDNLLFNEIDTLYEKITNMNNNLKLVLNNRLQNIILYNRYSKLLPMVLDVIDMNHEAHGNYSLFLTTNLCTIMTEEYNYVYNNPHHVINEYNMMMNDNMIEYIHN